MNELGGELRCFHMIAGLTQPGVPQKLCRRGPLMRSHPQTRLDELAEALREVGLNRGAAREPALCGHSVLLERELEGRQAIGHHPQAPDVGAVRACLCLQLGGRVFAVDESLSRVPLRGIHELQADPVGDHDTGILVRGRVLHVLRPQILVYNTLLVREGQRRGQLIDDPLQPTLRHCGVLALEKIAARIELHDDVDLCVILKGLKRPLDVGMVQRPHGLDIAQQRLVRLFGSQLLALLQHPLAHGVALEDTDGHKVGSQGLRPLERRSGLHRLSTVLLENRLLHFPLPQLDTTMASRANVFDKDVAAVVECPRFVASGEALRRVYSHALSALLDPSLVPHLIAVELLQRLLQGTEA
mmetsp:Transcript_58425/g.125544  ORF Transcript_58425/g.125544 Transcript_58425/m.125544 type:complete len:357 (+) Transcript_58425:653-1723(+)